MGLYISKVFNALTGSKEMGILMIGLDAAGKTTILYKLRLGEVVSTIPTIGFNVETVEYKNISFTVWDVGGQDSIRPLWRYYYADAEGLIFVVDSADRDRFDEAKKELQGLMQEKELENCSVLILANKQDLPSAQSPASIAQALGVDSNPNVYTKGCIGTSGDGLYEGLDWLSKEISKRQSSQKH